MTKHLRYKTETIKYLVFKISGISKGLVPNIVKHYQIVWKFEGKTHSHSEVIICITTTKPKLCNKRKTK